MQLNDQQWKKLGEIFGRITLDQSARQAFIIPIARAVDKYPDDAPFASWQTISGHADFFTIMSNVIQRSDEPALRNALVCEVRQRSLREADKQTIDSWFQSGRIVEVPEITNEHRETVTDGTKDIGSLGISPELSEILAQSIKEFEAYRQKQQKLVIDTIAKLLDAADALKSNIVDAEILSLTKPTESATASTIDSQQIAAALLNQPRPIDTLCDIVDQWSELPSKFNFLKEDAYEFHAILDILAIHSLPNEDRNQVRTAMLRARAQLLAKEPSSNLAMPFSSENKLAVDYAVTLLRQTWIVLYESNEKISEMLRLLLNRKPASQAEKFRLLRKVRILNEPPDASDDEFIYGLTVNTVAQHLVNEIEGFESPVGDPVSHLKNTILPRLARRNEFAVMFVSNRRKMNDYLSLLDKDFPGVLCICLADIEANQYRAVTFTVRSILENLPQAYLLTASN